MKEFEQLIDETLGGKRINVASRDIATNSAGLELLDQAEKFLPELEEFVRHCAQVDSSYSPDQFGMEYLLGAFVVGSVRSNRREGFEIVRSLPDDWLKAVIGSASIFFLEDTNWI